MFAPETADPATGAVEPLAGAAVAPEDAPLVVVAVGEAGLVLEHPAIKTATITKIIAKTLMCENFIRILPVQLNSLQPLPAWGIR